MTQAILVTPTRKVFVSTAPTLRNTYTNSSGTNVSPAQVDLTVTGPGGTATTYSNITASSTGVFEKQVTFDAAGRWKWKWVATDANGKPLTDYYQMQVYASA